MTTRVLALIRNTHPQPQRSNHPQPSQAYPSTAFTPVQVFRCLLMLSLRITFLHRVHCPMTFRNFLFLRASSGWLWHTWRARSLNSAPPLKVVQKSHVWGRLWLFSCLLEQERRGGVNLRGKGGEG